MSSKLLFILLFIGSIATFGQTPTPTREEPVVRGDYQGPVSKISSDVPRTIYGGILNGKSTSLPKPEYSKEQLKLEGKEIVRVKVLVDEYGNVASADLVTEPFSDHQQGDDGNPVTTVPEAVSPILEEACLNAAKAAKFSPTLLSGKPVKISGIIIYNFAYLEETHASRLIPLAENTLNQNVTSQLPVEYPAAALAVRAEGIVTVSVTINEEGNVISAEAVSGHPLLRAAAVRSARKLRFTPTILQGEPYKVTGMLKFNFIAPKIKNQ